MDVIEEWRVRNDKVDCARYRGIVQHAVTGMPAAGAESRVPDRAACRRSGTPVTASPLTMTSLRNSNPLVNSQREIRSPKRHQRDVLTAAPRSIQRPRRGVRLERPTFWKRTCGPPCPGAGLRKAKLENGKLSSAAALYKNLIHPRNTDNSQDTRMSRIFQPLLYIYISVRNPPGTGPTDSGPFCV